MFLFRSFHSETQSFELNGDIILGGLFPVHRKSKYTENACGNIDTQPGFQYLAAMLFAIKEINNDPNLLPNITLGAKIYDTCRSQTIAGDRAKDIIKYTLMGHKAPLAAVIGPLVSDVSIAVANLLRVFNIPQISYGSTSADLSNKEIYSNFFRTVPPDSFQAHALVDILREYKWNYIFTVSSYGNYGQKGMAELQKAAKAAGICVASAAQLPRLPSYEDFKNVIRNFIRKRTETSNYVNTIVVFTTQSDSGDLLRAANESGATQFTWVGSNGWSNRIDVTEGKEEVADGSLTVNHLEGEVPRFEKHFLNLKPTDIDNMLNPWFEEFWEAVMDCNIPETKQNTANELRTCRSDERVPVEIEMAPVRVVINAVYAVAHALHNMQKVYCPGVGGVCENMTRKFQTDELLQFLRNVTFPDSSSVNFTVRFNRHQEMNGVYNIENFHKGKDGKWKYSNIGSWQGQLLANDEVQGMLKMNKSLIQWGKFKPHPPLSFCSHACNSSQIRKPRLGDTECCWDCIDCEGNYIVKNDTCQLCPLGFSANHELQVCTKIPLMYPKWSSAPGVIFCVLIGLGMLGTLATALLFVRHRRHHFIKAAGRELSTMVFIGIMLCYASPFTFLGKPTATVCGVRRFFGSVCYTVCYAPVLMKTIRIYRIFTNAESSVTRPSLTRPKSQVLISTGLIAVQLLLTTLWNISDVPRVKEVYPSKGIATLECAVNVYTLAVNLSYNSLLMLFCTIFAFKTRNFPRNFNEAKYIGISMYLTCSVWTIFIPTYLNTSNAIWRVYLACAAFITVATITLLGLLVPKVIIVIFTNGQYPSVSESYTTHGPQGYASNRRLSCAPIGSHVERRTSFEMDAGPTNSEFPPSQFLTVRPTDARNTPDSPKKTHVSTSIEAS